MRTAIMLAPLLAVAGYVAAGYYAARRDSEKVVRPPALELRPAGECRLMEGACRFRRDHLVVDIAARPTEQGDTLITLTPSEPIQGAVMGIHARGNETPRNLRRFEGEERWFLIFSGVLDTPVKIRLILAQGGRSWFAEIEAR